MRHLLNIILRLLPPTRWFIVKSWLLERAKVEMGNNVKVCGYSIFSGSGHIAIGDNTWVGMKAGFYTSNLARVKIGKNCDIGPEVVFVSGSHEMGENCRRAGKGTAGDIDIGDGCWIGAKVIILGGVTIGDGAIVAAGSLLRNDVPANTLVAGVPAVVKKRLS